MMGYVCHSLFSENLASMILETFPITFGVVIFFGGEGLLKFPGVMRQIMGLSLCRVQYYSKRRLIK